jgi:ribosome-binding factor A
MKNHRLARVSEAIREVASEAILFELRDPRIKFVTVTRAEVSADLQHAKVYVSVMGSEQDRKLTMHGLKSASGFIQSKLAERMKTRYVPAVHFFLDEGQRNSMEVAKLLAQEKPSDDENVPEDDPAEGDLPEDDLADDELAEEDLAEDDLAEESDADDESPAAEATPETKQQEGT